jgi:uracil-DNA glycosylase
MITQTKTEDEAKLIDKLGESWFEEIADEFKKEYMIKLHDFLAKEIASNIIYPPHQDTLNAFKLCPLDKVKVVILGQDPYHGPNQAHGLCFSVQDGIKPPPSLVNIFKELNRDLEIEIPSSGNLSHWAHQGVFLLNTCLSVRAGEAGAHFNKGWEIFTDKVIETVNQECKGLVFMLWGSAARKKAAMIDSSRHLILEAPHPSPLSAHRGFLGCGHFSKANEYLLKQGREPINWQI